MELHINAAQRLALWGLNKACVSSASLQRASKVSAPLYRGLPRGSQLRKSAVSVTAAPAATLPPSKSLHSFTSLMRKYCGSIEPGRRINDEGSQPGFLSRERYTRKQGPLWLLIAAGVSQRGQGMTPEMLHSQQEQECDYFRQKQLQIGIKNEFWQRSSALHSSMWIVDAVFLSHSQWFGIISFL